MSLIIYPNDNANTFADMGMANSVIHEFFPEKAAEWDALPQDIREAGLLQSFIFMTTCNGLVIPEEYGDAGNTIASDFILAQVFLTVSRIGQSIFDMDDNTRAVIKEKAGDLEVDYDSRYKRGDHLAPELYYQLMSKYGCTSGGGFSQTYMGRS